MCQDRSENGRSSNTDAASTRARNGSPERRSSNPDSQASFPYQGVGRHNDDRRRDLGGSLRLITEEFTPNGSRHSTPVEKSNIWLHDLALASSPINHQYSNGKRSRDKMERDLDDQLERAKVDGFTKRLKHDSKRHTSDSIRLEDPSSSGTSTNDNNSSDQARRRRHADGAPHRSGRHRSYGDRH
ncbi:predicted protein [Verticillium alfalfae VaMs.102]|uniref:Predicted protein n=1 Tax=Verticillium alfalfae (strain VaMs.102 / ATCC MYA-4576 / FGSC 10136) TaxID=526221 RepID=C9STL5_VERA1|nr:predicted protein [Verticillium alfalfae VaMs.102]EEY22176.1 predicted protein [Verticillium alfalfae VaMs.102]